MPVLKIGYLELFTRTCPSSNPASFNRSVLTVPQKLTANEDVRNMYRTDRI